MKRFRLLQGVCALTAAVLTLGTATVGAQAAHIDDKAPVAAAAPAKTAEGAYPSSYSSRDLGYVTSVKSQAYSSCWVYASLAVLESALLRAGFYTEDMSPDHMNIWATPHSDGTGWQRSVTADGYPSIPLGYLTAWQGGIFQSEVGGLSVYDGNVSSDALPDVAARYGTTSIEFLTRDNPGEIKRCIMTYGGVYSSYAHAGACLGTDGYSLYMPSGYNGSYMGHSIEVVGWDDSYPRERFNADDKKLPAQNGAWLMKSSWGNSTPIDGYYWISYEDAYLFGRKYTPSYAITGVEPIDSTKKLIQNEIYGATYEFSYINSQKLTYMNRLHFDSDYNVIDKVMFKTAAVGADYTIYYVPDGDNNTPDADQSHWTKLHEGTVDYEGYLCADIDNFAYPDSTGTIAVTLDASKAGVRSTFGVGEWLTNSSGYVFKNNSRRGESYIMHNGQVQDLLDWYKENENDDMGGTFVIKAITVKDYPATLLGDADNNGIVNIQDVTVIQRHLAELLTLEKTALSNADFNQDGVVDIDDATMIQRFLAEFPVS